MPTARGMGMPTLPIRSAPNQRRPAPKPAPHGMVPWPPSAGITAPTCGTAPTASCGWGAEPMSARRPGHPGPSPGNLSSHTPVNAIGAEREARSTRHRYAAARHRELARCWRAVEAKASAEARMLTEVQDTRRLWERGHPVHPRRK